MSNNISESIVQIFVYPKIKQRENKYKCKNEIDRKKINGKIFIPLISVSSKRASIELSDSIKIQSYIWSSEILIANWNRYFVIKKNINIINSNILIIKQINPIWYHKILCISNILISMQVHTDRLICVPNSILSQEHAVCYNIAT